MQSPAVKIIAYVSFIIFTFSFQYVDAQRLQVQVQVAGNNSEAHIQDNGQSVRETRTFWDTVPGSQLGLALNARIYKKFYLRLDGNYRAYRTFFRTEEVVPGGNTNYILGNLYNEKFNVSLLPEYRLQLTKKSGKVQVPGYVFAGPVLSFERGKNYVYTLDVPTSYTSTNEVNPAAGWSVGAGINPKWAIFGLLFEARYTRFGYAEESLAVGKIAYNHLTFMFGLSIDLVK